MIFHRKQLSSPPRLVVKHSPNVKSERKVEKFYTADTYGKSRSSIVRDDRTERFSQRFEEMKCFNHPDTLQKVPAATKKKKKKLLQSFCSKQTNQKKKNFLENKSLKYLCVGFTDLLLPLIWERASSRNYF